MKSKKFTDEKETKMTNLSDFLKCEKVRLLTNGYTNLDKGSEYNLVRLEVVISNNMGLQGRYPLEDFEPVIETAIQATNALDDTPMGTVNEFEVGDKIYFGINPKIYTVIEVKSKVLVVKDTNHPIISPNLPITECCHATPENYEMLCKLYPHIEFEAPAKELTGSDLCRAKLKQGENNISCYVGNSGDSTDNKRAIVSGYNNSGQFYTDFGLFNNAVPFDPKTGNVLTSEVLDDQ